MAIARASLLVAAAFFCAAGLSAADTTNLRAQLSRAGENEDTLARIELLRRILDADPDDDASHRALIEGWRQIEDYDLAEATLTAWPSAPADLAALTRAEIQRHRDRDVPGAIRTLRAHLAAAPKDVAAHRALASALLTQNDAAAQVAALDALIALAPDAPSLLQRANAKFRLAAYPDALLDAKAAQALAPDDPAVKNNLPSFERLAEALAALPPLDAALTKNPRDGHRLIERAWWRRYGGILDRSLADANAALVIAPDSVAGKITRARARYLLDQIKAEDALRDELVDVNRPHSLEAILAVADADRALAKNPRDAAQLRARAHALNAAGQSRLALRDAGAAIALAPKDANAALEALYATALLDQDPAPLLRQIEAMRPPGSQLALANAYLADFHLRQTQLPLALEFADRSLRFAETAYALRLKAAALQRLGRPDEASAATRRANALSP
jgi:tetratricopeptide (TPR) repeat protein